MNRQMHQTEAEKYNKPGMAYVHAEYHGGADNQLMISGDGVALIRVVERIMTRLSVLRGTSFDDVMDAVQTMHDLEEGITAEA